MDDDALEALRREAEHEMRRKAPRALDGTDLGAKRRKTFDAKGGGGDDGAEADESLERFEYTAPTAITNGLGCVGFVVTCSFMREKSATREATEMLRPRLPATPLTNGVAPNGLRLNPVKMPGRGFLLIRMSERDTNDPNTKKDAKDDEGNEETNGKDEEKNRAIVAAEAVGVVSRTVADVRAGKCPAPKFVEKIMPIAVTTGFEAESLNSAAIAALTASGFDPSIFTNVSFAVVYHNRFKTQGDPTGKGKEADKGKDAGAESKHGRMEIIEGLAAGIRAALTAAGATTATVDLKDPDVVVFAEVISVPMASESKGGHKERFTRRLAVGVVPKSTGAFERRKKGIMASSLKKK
jgi:hypothetical protein